MTVTVQIPHGRVDGRVPGCAEGRGSFKSRAPVVEVNEILTAANVGQNVQISVAIDVREDGVQRLEVPVAAPAVTILSTFLHRTILTSVKTKSWLHERKFSIF